MNQGDRGKWTRLGDAMLLAGTCAAAALAPVGLATVSLWAALGFQIAARLTYMLYAALSLQAQSWRLVTQTPEEGLRRHEAFRRWLIPIQNADGFAFVGLAFATRGTLHPPYSWLCVGFGALLLVTGVVAKMWAVRAIGPGSYSWHDFFVPRVPFVPCRTGPYRFMSDPMYTLGYLHPYGVALLLFSWPALLAALFQQVSILVLGEFVERPHFRRLTGQAAPEKTAPRRRGRRSRPSRIFAPDEA